MGKDTVTALTQLPSGEWGTANTGVVTFRPLEQTTGYPYNMDLSTDNTQLVIKITYHNTKRYSIYDATTFAHVEDVSLGDIAYGTNSRDVVWADENTLFVLDENQGIVQITKSDSWSTATHSILTPIADLYSSLQYLDITSNGQTLGITTANAFFLVDVNSGNTVKQFGDAGASGYTDGDATTSRFYSVRGIAFSADATANSGYAYVAEYSNRRIRKIDLSTNMVSTLAGTGSSGNTDASTGASAKFSDLKDIVLSGDYLIVSDASKLLRSVHTSTGATATLAGSSYGTTAGTGTAEQLHTPDYLAVNANVVYFGSSSYNQLGKMEVAAAAGPEVLMATEIDACVPCEPGSVSVGGNVTSCTCAGGYHRAAVTETTPNSDAKGLTTTPIGGSYGSSNGVGTSVQFNGVQDVKIVSGGSHAVVVDKSNHRLRLWDLTSDSVSTLAGSSYGFSDGTGTSAQFWNPQGMCVDPLDDNIVYVTDQSNSRIRQVNVNTAVVTTFMSTSAQPLGCVISHDRFLIYSDNTDIHEVSIGGATITKTYPNSPHNAHKLALTPDDKTILFANYNDKNVYTIDRQSDTRILLAGSGTNANTDGTGDGASFYYPIGVAVDKDGIMVYVSTRNSVRSIVLATGVVETLAGPVGSTSTGNTDGSGSSATFNYVTGMDITPDGLYLLAAISEGHSVRKISLGPYSVTTYTGSCTSCGENRTSLAADAGLGPAACQWDCAADMYVGTDSVTEVTVNPLGVVGTVGSSTLSLAGALAFVGTDSDFIYHRNNGVVLKTQISNGNEHTVFTTEGNYWVDALAGSPAHANLIMVASRSPHKICVYDLDANTCVFTKSLSYDAGSGSVAMSPDGTAIAYKVPHSGSSGSICENSISFDAENCYSISGNWAGDNGGLAFTRDGQYIIASNQASDPRVLKITRGATMTAVDIVDTATVGSPFTPRGVAVDADGYVRVVEHAAKIWKLDLSDPGGNVAWTPFATSTFSGGYAVGGTYGVAITPDDSTMYIEAN